MCVFVQIYQAMIRDEEVRTGQRSTLNWNAPLEEVLSHDNVLIALTERTCRCRWAGPTPTHDVTHRRVACD